VQIRKISEFLIASQTPSYNISGGWEGAGHTLPSAINTVRNTGECSTGERSTSERRKDLRESDGIEEIYRVSL
jgi:hypothetical protein